MRRVIVLRPEPGASATIERLRERGMDAIAAPLLEIEPMAWTAPDPGSFDGVLLTSGNAVRSGGDELLNLRGLPAYAVGSRTAELARGRGFEVRRVGRGGVDELLDELDPALRLLHLCGEDRKQPAAALKSITPVVVYRSRKVEEPKLPSLANAVALIHSPQIGARFAELVIDRSNVRIAAISGAAADSAGAGWEVVEVAARPNEDAMLALAERLCNKPDPQ